MERSYPTRFGVPIDPQELALPPSQLDVENKHSFNNHHLSYYARFYGRIILLNVFRDLEGHQSVIPIDQHNWIHANYTPPEIPTPHEAIERVVMAYETGERLKTGSANNPEFKPITEPLMQRVHQSYESFNL